MFLIVTLMRLIPYYFVVSERSAQIMQKWVSQNYYEDRNMLTY